MGLALKMDLEKWTGTALLARKEYQAVVAAVADQTRCESGVIVVQSGVVNNVTVLEIGIEQFALTSSPSNQMLKFCSSFVKNMCNR